MANITEFLKEFKMIKPATKKDVEFAAKHPVTEPSFSNAAKNKKSIWDGSNVKMYNRHSEHGYNPGEDAAKYEEIQPEQIDELSKSTLRSYVNKAAGKIGSESANMHHKNNDEQNKSIRKIVNRVSGINLATAKLAPDSAVVKVPAKGAFPKKKIKEDVNLLEGLTDDIKAAYKKHHDSFHGEMTKHLKEQGYKKIHDTGKHEIHQKVDKEHDTIRHVKMTKADEMGFPNFHYTDTNGTSGHYTHWDKNTHEDMRHALHSHSKANRYY